MCTSEGARRLSACIWQTAWRSATLAVARRRLTKGIAVRNKDQRSDPTSLARLVNVCLSDVSKRGGKHVYAQSFWILVILLGLLWGACAGVLHMDNGDPLFEDLNIACTMQTKDAWYQQGKTNNECLISMCDHLCWPNLTLFFDRIDISKAYLHFHHRCIRFQACMEFWVLTEFWFGPCNKTWGHWAHGLKDIEDIGQGPSALRE